MNNNTNIIITCAFAVSLLATSFSLPLTKGPDKSAFEDFCSPTDTIGDQVARLLQMMTLSEKALLLTGINGWDLHGVERLGIPSINVKDGGHGITIRSSGCATSFPTAIAQAATWDDALIAELGGAIAREAKSKGISIVLAPMVNIQRIPVNGRNYESFSEDPFLTGKMATGFINGLQAEQVGAVIKHLAANNQQYEQKHIKSRVEERVLHEIYLPAFKMAIAEADPVGVMTAYNGVNGYPSSESSYLIKDVLKKRWQYPGFVVSDWRSVHSENVMQAGLDLEMPGPGVFMTQELVLDAVKKGTLPISELDDKVSRYIRALFHLGLIWGDRTVVEDNAVTASTLMEAHRPLAQRVAESAIVLLKNDRNVLPLDTTAIKRLAVIGPNAAEMRLSGGGSASVTACAAVSPLAGLKQYLPPGIAIDFVEGTSLKGGMPAIPGQYLSSVVDGKRLAGLTGAYHDGHNYDKPAGCIRQDAVIDFSWGWGAPCDQVDKTNYAVRWQGKLTAPSSGGYKLGLSFDDAGARLYIDGALVIDDWGDPANEITEAKFRNRSLSVDYELKEGREYDIVIEFHKKERTNSIRFEWQTPEAEDGIAQAVAVAGGSDAVIVFAGISNFYEGGNNDREDIDLPGRQNELIQRVLAANKNTVIVLINGTPLAMPWIDKAPAVVEAFYPGQEGGVAIARVLFGAVNPSGKLPQTFPKQLADVAAMSFYPGSNGEVRYDEGLFVGYRQFDKDGIEPLFPFGFGLSYTTFEFSNLQVKRQGKNGVLVRVDLKNVGNRSGSEVAQFYVSPLEAKVDRPVKELKAFKKIALAPGETKTLEVLMDESAFNYYQVEKGDWVVEPGKFEISVGNSSKHLHVKEFIYVN